MINRLRLIRFAWAMYQFAPMIAVVVVAGLMLGWAPTLFLGSLFVALFVWLLRSAKRDVRRMQTDPEYASQIERESQTYFKAMGLGVPVAMGVLLVLLVIAAVAR